MIGPSRLLRLTILAGIGLLVRAIVRESEAQRPPAPLLPPPTLKARKRRRA